MILCYGIIIGSSFICYDIVFRLNKNILKIQFTARGPSQYKDVILPV